MTVKSLAHHAHEPTTREERALELYRHYGAEIEKIAPDIYLVPSQDGERVYRVQYGEHEFCSCPDYQYRGVSCVHLLAVGIWHAKHRVRPEVLSGDPFAYAGRSEATRDPAPHGCYNGLVYIGHLDVDPETGDEFEVIEARPCKRCKAPLA